MTGWARKTPRAGAFDQLLDDFAMAGPEARGVIQPLIYTKTIDWRKAARRGRFSDEEIARMEKRLSDYSRRVRKMKAA